MTQLHLFTHEFHPFKGGIARYCEAFADAAAKDPSLAVSVFGPSSSRRPNSESAAGYTHHRGRYRGNHGPMALYLSGRQIQRSLASTPDCVCLLAEPGAILAYGIPFRKPKTARILVTLHGSEILRWQKNPFARSLAERTFKDAVAINCVSQPIADLAKMHLPAFAGKIRAVRNALSAEFLAQANSHRTARSQAPTPEEPFRILSVGRIHPRKGFDQVIRAIAKLPEALKAQIHYTIAGGSPKYNYDRELRALSDSLSVRTRIEIQPSDTQLKALYADADLFALTSQPFGHSIEGFGLVYLEAAAYGLPSLAYDSGGVSDAIEDGENGYLIAPGDIKQLGRRIQDLFHDPDLRSRLGTQAKARAACRDWQAVVDESLSPIENQ